MVGMICRKAFPSTSMLLAICKKTDLNGKLELLELIKQSEYFPSC